MTLRNLVSITLAAIVLAACGGGGDPEPEQSQSAAVPQPEVVSISVTNMWPDVYPKFRLNFDSPTIVGFAEIPGEAVKPEDLEVRWHSGGATAPAASPNAPRGAIQRDASGKLYADIQMFYGGDRGIYVLVKRGFGPYQDVNGQPGAYMLPDKWKLPAGMTVVDIAGPFILRQWIDWKDPGI